MPRIDAHTHLFAPAQSARRRELAANDPTFAELYADPEVAVVHVRCVEFGCFVAETRRV